jgi:EpsI family protein
MIGSRLNLLVIGAAMLCAAGLSYALRPSVRVSDNAAAVNLEQMVPREFGGWKIDPNIVPVRVSPEVQAKLDATYNQTLSRTYVSAGGERIMLSIAYGGAQSDDLSIHHPEACYTAQGFQVLAPALGQLVTEFGVVPVKRLFAVLGPRKEPITYWITVGEQATHSPFQEKLTRFRYGLTGQIPDGILVRVSSINVDRRSAYAQQESFVRDLLAAMQPKDRARLVGRLGG